jgi:hypothetical protein
LTNGYQFTSYDYGQKIFYSLLKFNRSGYFQLVVRDNNGNEQSIQFNVDTGSSESNVRGFTTTELRKITNVSRIWYDVVAELKRTSTKLRTDSYWQRLSDTLYTNMRDVVDNRSYRVFEYYSDFLRGFNEWYTYTARNA